MASEHDISAFLNYAKKQGVKEDQATALFYASRGSVVKDTKGDADNLTGEEFGMLWAKYKDMIKGVLNKKVKEYNHLPECMNVTNFLYLLGLYDDTDDYAIYISVESGVSDCYSLNCYTQEGDLLSSTDINSYENNKWVTPNNELVQDRVECEALNFIDTFSNPYTETIINNLNLSNI